MKAAILAVPLASLAACGAPPSGDLELFAQSCAGCHALEVPLSKGKTEEGWRRTVWVMRQRGARLTDAEAERIVRYLAASRPPR